MNKIILPLIALFCFAHPVFAEDWGIMSPYLPLDGKITGNLRIRMSSEKILEIKGRLDKTIEKQNEWYAKYIKNHDLRKPLPYHPNFGITEKEYEALIKTYGPGDNRVFENAGKIELQFKKLPNGDVIVSSDDVNNSLHNLRYVVKENSIVSKHGTLNIYSDAYAYIDKEGVKRSRERLMWKRNAIVGKDGEGPFLLFTMQKSLKRNMVEISYMATHLGDNVKEPLIIEFSIVYELSN